jgi:hypothetical protein
MSEYDEPFAVAQGAGNRQAELRKTRLEVAFRDALKKPYVRVLLQEMIIATGFYGPMSAENPQNAKQVGKREMALWLRQHIAAIDFSLLQRMETEAAVEIPDPRQPREEPDD